jgi:TolB-like protein/class 3 adenylate cyclase
LTGENVQRRLTAILAADVAGYSRLMGADEEGTLAQLKACRKTLVDPKIAEHRGRIVKTTGDGMLVEFASAVDAARLAVELQRRMNEQNTDVPQAKRIEFRIGIHVGDIIIDDDDIFGDGVNIAARLEGIAEPGGVCISDDTHRQIRGKVDIAFDDMGPQTLKNIAEPMRAWRCRIDATQSSPLLANPPAEIVQPLALPDKPSIAVLPFQNMSGDPEQDYFADGMVEDIITALSRFKSLFVIARNSSFTYKGNAVDIKQVGRELGVRYVLEGSVRKAGDRVRITGQLIDATTGAHLWADRIEGALEDFFGLQDKVTEQVIGAIAPEIERAEIERANRRPIGSIDAVTEHYRGLPHVYRPTTPANNDIALQHFRNAIALDPNFLPAYGAAAICILWRRVNFWSSDIPKDDALILSFAERIKELNTEDAFTLDALGMALFYNALNVDAGKDLNERAIRSNPNFASAYHTRGWFQVWDGGSDAAITDFEEHLRRSPRDPFAFNSMIGIAFAHYNASRYAEAAIWADKSIRAFPYFIGGLQIAVTCYVEAGRIEDARRVMAEVLRLHPKWSFSRMKGYRGPIRSPEVRVKQWTSFRKAGLPE